MLSAHPTATVQSYTKHLGSELLHLMLLLFQLALLHAHAFNAAADLTGHLVYQSTHLIILLSAQHSSL